MSKEKPISPEVKGLENQIENLKEDNEKLSAYPELLETEKALRAKTEKELDIAYAILNKIKKWAEEFERFSDSDYKGSFIHEEIHKLIQEKKNDSDDKL